MGPGGLLRAPWRVRARLEPVLGPSRARLCADVCDFQNSVFRPGETLILGPPGASKMGPRRLGNEFQSVLEASWERLESVFSVLEALGPLEPAFGAHPGASWAKQRRKRAPNGLQLGGGQGVQNSSCSVSCWLLRPRWPQDGPRGPPEGPKRAPEALSRPIWDPLGSRFGAEHGRPDPRHGGGNCRQATGYVIRM